MREIDEVVDVCLNEILSNAHPFDPFLDILAEGVGEPLLQDIGYQIVGFHDNQNVMKIRVTGYVDEWEEFE